MSLPTPDKTYVFSKVNLPVVSSGVRATDVRNALLAIKDALITIGSSPCTVVGSSDGSTGALDSVDRWIDAGDLIVSNNDTSNPKSWIVLDVAGLGGQLLFSLSDGDDQGRKALVYYSPGSNFTGGSNVARPTASDEIAIPKHGDLWCNLGSAQNTRVHLIQSTDGKVRHVFVYSLGVLISYWHLSEAKGPITEWATPWVISIATEATYTTLYSNAYLRSKIGSDAVGLVFTGESVLSTPIGAYQTAGDDDSGEFPLFPIGLYCLTAGHKGRKGLVFDLWWGLSTNGEGDTYPLLSSSSVPVTREFVQFGDLVIPWNGTPTVPGDLPLTS